MASYAILRNNKIQQDLLPKPVKSGSGLINNIIDNMPFEAHLPGMQYAGPGTNLDLKLLQGVKPANKLDEAAMNHDIAYSKTRDLNKRHEADYKLQEDAWKRVKAGDSSLGEKANAWLVTTAMKAKRMLGAGVGSKNILYPANLDETCTQKLINAIKKGKAVTLVLRCNRTKESVANDTRLPLTPRQARDVKAKHVRQRDAKIRFTGPQIKFMKSAEGEGLMSGILSLLPEASAAVYNAWENKKANNRLVEERIRHNKAIEALAAQGKGGEGVYINKATKSADGDGVFINKLPNSKSGNGLYKELLKKKKSL